jgi:hypothetical protein
MAPRLPEQAVEDINFYASWWFGDTKKKAERILEARTSATAPAAVTSDAAEAIESFKGLRSGFGLTKDETQIRMLRDMAQRRNPNLLHVLDAALTDPTAASCSVQIIAVGILEDIPEQYVATATLILARGFAAVRATNPERYERAFNPAEYKSVLSEIIRTLGLIGSRFPDQPDAARLLRQIADSPEVFWKRVTYTISDARCEQARQVLSRMGCVSDTAAVVNNRIAPPSGSLDEAIKAHQAEKAQAQSYPPPRHAQQPGRDSRTAIGTRGLDAPGFGVRPSDTGRTLTGTGRPATTDRGVFAPPEMQEPPARVVVPAHPAPAPPPRPVEVIVEPKMTGTHRETVQHHTNINKLEGLWKSRKGQEDAGLRLAILNRSVELKTQDTRIVALALRDPNLEIVRAGVRLGTRQFGTELLPILQRILSESTISDAHRAILTQAQDKISSIESQARTSRSKRDAPGERTQTSGYLSERARTDGFQGKDANLSGGLKQALDVAWYHEEQTRRRRDGAKKQGNGTPRRKVGIGNSH